jgi:hypothetical protein
MNNFCVDAKISSDAQLDRSRSHVGFWSSLIFNDIELDCNIANSTLFHVLVCSIMSHS